MNWKNMVGATLLGLLGMGTFQVGGCVYQDWKFLHAARLINEQRAAAPASASPKPTPAPSPAE